MPEQSSSSFTSLKLDIQRVAVSDKRLSGGQLRFLLYVLHSSWPDDNTGLPRTRLADEAIMDDVPGHAAQSTCYRTRTHIAELGYWTYQAGLGIQATVYWFARDPAPGALALLNANEARRDADVKARLKALLDNEETLQSQHKAKRASRKDRGRKSVQSEHTDALETMQIATHPCVENEGMSPPSSPPQGSLPDQNVAIGDFEPETGEIPLPIRERGGTRIIPICDKCDQPAVIRCGILGDCFCRKHEWMVTRPEPIAPDPAKPIDYRALSRGE